MFFGKKKNASKAEPKARAADPAPAAAPEPEVELLEPEQDAAAEAVTLEFHANGSGLAYLSSGWSRPEAKAVWSIGPRASLDLSSLNVGRRGGWNLKIKFAAYIAAPVHASQQIDLFVGNEAIGSWTVSDGKPAEYEVHVPERVLYGDVIVVEFAIARPTSPSTINPASKDVRALGIALSSITVSEV